MVENVLRYESLINKLARENYINVTVNEEDVRQALWTKVMELMPRLKDMPREDAFKYVKRSLKNNITDIIINECRTPGSSQYSLRELNFDEMLGDEVSSVFDKLSDFGQEDYLIGKELLLEIIEWAEDQPELFKKFILERLETSDEMEHLWQERVKVTKRGKNLENIPIWSMLKILGINQQEYYKRVGHSLTNHLRSHGYEV